MLLRKINAGLSLFSTLFLLEHAVFIALYIFSRGRILNPIPKAGWILSGLVAAHAFISVALAISAHRNGGKQPYKSYPKMNLSTVIQRASGILLLPFIALHVAGATGAMTPPRLIHSIVPPLFFLVALAHTAVSFSKALITLGIGNARFVRVADIVMKLICVLTLVADIVGFYLLYGF